MTGAVETCSVGSVAWVGCETGGCEVVASRWGVGEAESIDAQYRTQDTTTILVVEDEPSYQEVLQIGLEREGYLVQMAPDGYHALKCFAHEPPDLVLLDLLLPDISGADVCRRMLGIASVPIIMVSALGTERDIVVGLETGATDYVTKPYRLSELVARIRSVLRRAPAPAPLASSVPETAPSVRLDRVTVGHIRVDFASRMVTFSGRAVHLSRREFDLLALLLSPPGRVRTREELIDRLWSGSALTDTRTLDTHIRRLRAKLELDARAPQRLGTVRGVGFRFEIDGPVHASPADFMA